VRTDRAKVVDPCGVVLAETDDLTNVIWRDINLDYMVCHYDFNHGVPDRIMAAYGARVEIRSHRDDAHFMIEPRDPTITTAQLCREFGIEPTMGRLPRHTSCAFHVDAPCRDPWPRCDPWAASCPRLLKG